MSIKSEVENIIQKRWEGFKNPNELISWCNIEKQTNQGYDGRQLLELFQNCEDEGASKVKILLDTENSLLEISNDGNKSFSIKGYNSIFYPGLSSKVSSGYIGNKGLGFRSIINWANQISIISNNFRVVFNNDFKKEILLNKIGYTEDDLVVIRKERKLNENVYPLPFLNSCKIDDLDTDHNFTTTISINYKKDYEDSIINQIKSISAKTLLFLHNINDIEIVGDTINENISVTRKKLGQDNFQINYDGNEYYVISDEGIVDDDLIDDKESSEQKKYSVKIAYNEDLSFRDNVIYNYFKTQIPFELPFVVHASLELDQNRNHGTESKINPFILDKLFNLHLRFINILKNKFDKSWLPYQTINNDSYLVYKPYSDIIYNYWGNFEIYPTLSGKYLNKNEAKTLGNNIANFLGKNKLETYFENHIVYFDEHIDLKQYIDKPKNYTEIIERLASDLNFQNKAIFIKLIIENFPLDKFSVLIDEQNKLIPIIDYIYTDKTLDNKELKVPNYSKIKFLHPELYKSLINVLGLQNESQKSRLLKDKLEMISDVHSFEPQTVIKKIISETNDLLNNFRDKKQEIIKEFYQILFHNYRVRGEKSKVDYDSKIPCLNELNEIEDIKKLVLSDEFSIGKFSKQIFGQINDKGNIISGMKNLGLENENITEIEDFLKWLGINHFSIVERKTANIDSQYINYVSKKYNASISSYELFTVKNLDKIIAAKTIDINHIIVWISIDEKLKDIFNNYTLTYSKNEKLSHSYYGIKDIHPFINFIYYTITLHFNITNYLITSKKEEWFNPFKIKYDYLKEINNNLDKNEVGRILLFFGAKKDFNDLKINYLKKKTQELANRINHKGAQVFYKSLVGHYKKNQEKILDINLYAKVGNEIEVKNSNEIYFSDRIQLPEMLTHKFPILFYPSRSGGAKAIEMFGLNSLNDLNLKLIEAIENKNISSEFENFIKEIKPFVLAFRLDKITIEDVKKNQVQLLNKLKINCCEQLVCSIDDESFDIEPYNYIYNNDQFYFNIPYNSTVESLKANKKFIDNLSDVYLKVFDVLDEKKIFESIIKQSKEDNVYDINNELGEGILEEAKILLGEISIRLSIWKSIFKIKDITDVAEINDNNLEEFINHYFPEIVIKELFNFDDNLDDISRIRNVFDDLSISLEEYNSLSDYKLTFDKLFQKEMKDYYEEQKKGLKNQLWNHLKDENSDKQKLFLNYLYGIERLLQNVSLNTNSSSYDFNKIILDELKKVFPFITFELENNNFHDYDLIEKENVGNFSDEELLEIRKNEILNSLSYFENQVDYIKSEILDKEGVIISEKSNGFNLNKDKPAEFIEGFQIELVNISSSTFDSGRPWLGGSSELSNEQKTKLGNDVEDVVKKYLDNNPKLYQLVEYISKTSQGEHYDIKYFDVVEQKIKYVECKYYNGSSFFLSREEKKFANNNSKQYEIWLVNKEHKIFCIKDIDSLGELQPVNYKVNIKIKNYEFAK